MFPRKEKVNKAGQSNSVDICQLKGTSTLKALLLIENKSESEKAIENIMRSMVSQVEVALQKEDCALCVKTFIKINESKKTYGNPQTLTPVLQQFYTSVIVKSEEEIVGLCCDTVQQSQCNEWFEARRCRISASANVHAIKRRIKKTVESLVAEMLFPKHVDTSSTRYGSSNESRALAEYAKLYGVSIKKVGLMISQKQPWLCASLDGVVIENGFLSRIVEMKCPSTCVKQPVFDSASSKCNVPYLEYRSGQLQLKVSAIYYTQCQIQLYISGLDICDLFVYSPVKNGSICVQVHRNENFLKEVIIKCESFYFQHYLLSLAVQVTAEKAQKKEPRTMTQNETRFTGKDISNQIK